MTGPSERALPRPALEVPASGLAGLRHWRHDLAAGLQVALLWTPFALGVALASGAPAVAGLISAIVAGLLFPFLGGSHVTVSGPAAALAPVVLWGILTLGQGDPAAGYPLVLVAIVLTGVLQILLSLVKAGRYATLLPSTVVEGMLAAIGIIIIVRQIPPLFGVEAAPAKSVLVAVLDLPRRLAAAEPTVVLVGLASLALMFLLNRRSSGFWKRLPAAILVTVAGVAAGFALDLPPELRIRMPERFLDALHLPDFAGILARPDLWGALVVVVVTFTLIDGVESVASVKAVDRIDPWRRVSDPNKTLRAMGVCNLCSGMLGGLTIIPNAVPSRANIDAGARTLWSNLFSGLFLLLFTLALPALIARIPLATIAGILVYIGWRLCEPALFARMLALGFDRFVVFVGTVVAILATDLLVGMFVGIAIELLLAIYLLMPSFRFVLTGRLDFASAMGLLVRNFAGLFRSPIIKARVEGEGLERTHVFTLGSLVGFNLLSLERAVESVPKREALILRFTESARIVDHTAMEFLQHLEEEAVKADRRFAIEGLERFFPFSAHPAAGRMQDAQIVRVRAEQDARAREMAALAARAGLAFEPETRATINRWDFVYLRRGEQRQDTNILTGVRGGKRIRIVDYGHTAAPDYHVVHRHTLLILEPQGAGEREPDLVITPGHYMERYMAHLEERWPSDLPPPHRLYGPPGLPRDALAVPAGWREALQTLGPLYVERRRGALLVFAPFRALEPIDRIEELLRAFAGEPEASAPRGAS
ncbi:MAG: SulP family inorganic anion transporter [Geminicoccaceae bacterium]|nr:SulP family inorganic anion transporter [Geminicoccaceae bacterium]